jgi:sulfur carrier protein ThiS
MGLVTLRPKTHMNIQLKLMGELKKRTPADGKLCMPSGATIEDVLRVLHLPPERAYVFSVNQQLILGRRHALTSGDELTIIPPVAGG